MANKPAIVVEPRPDGRWARQKDGSSQIEQGHHRIEGALTVGFVALHRIILPTRG